MFNRNSYCLGATDPFAQQPLPKSFYHPSPSKDVNKAEAIHGPLRAVAKKRNALLEEQFQARAGTYRTHALPNVQTFAGIQAGVVDVSGGSDRFNEVWSDNERLSAGISKNDISGLTSSLDDSFLNNTTAADMSNILSKWNKQDLNDVQARSTQEEKDNSVSVLQRYIERFRYSAPKPREERLKEKANNKKDFWWLDSSNPQPVFKTASPHTDGKGLFKERESRIRESIHSLHSSTNRGHRSKLTKEALAAMDEQTMELQKRAEKLLSRSELSLASSGPIVSTEGLGSSMSVSEHSGGLDDAVSHRSAAVLLPFHPEGVHSLSQVPKSRARIDPHVTNKPSLSAGGEDILIRWRLRRKMGDSDGMALDTGMDTLGSQRHCETLDPRLEEFRKKLFSQKALVIQNDIDFERQRMKMMLEEEEEIKRGASEKGSAVVQNQAMAGDSVMADPILQRLSDITGRGQNILEHRPQFVQTKHHEHQKLMDMNTNNIVQRDHHDNGAIENIAAMNVNNTALPYKSVHHDHGQESVSVDIFKEQQVCDASEKSHVLSSSEKLSGSQSEEILNDKHLRSKSKETPVNRKNEEDLGILKQDREETVVLKQIQIDREIVERNHGKASEFKMQENEEKSENKIFHQVLEAEKPSEVESEPSPRQIPNKHYTSKNKRSDNTRNIDRIKNSNCDEREFKSLKGHKDENLRNRSCKRKDERKRREEISQRDEQSLDSDVSDVTVESDRLSQKTSGREKPYRSDLSRKTSSESSSVTIPVEPRKEKPLREPERRQEKQHQPPPLSPPPSTRGTKPVNCASPQTHTVKAAVGQIVSDRMFDCSALISSVDSWSSLFPASPAPSRSLHDTVFTSPSPTRLGTSSDLVQSSTPITEQKEDEGLTPYYESDDEFDDDPLLSILRQQKKQYLEQLKLIELKLQQQL